MHAHAHTHTHDDQAEKYVHQPISGDVRWSNPNIYDLILHTYIPLLVTPHFLLTHDYPTRIPATYIKYDVVINTVSDPVTRRALASRLLIQVEHDTNDDEGIEV